MPSSTGPSPPRVQTHICFISCIGKWILATLEATKRPHIKKHFMSICPITGDGYLNHLIKVVSTNFTYCTIMIFSLQLISNLWADTLGRRSILFLTQHSPTCFKINLLTVFPTPSFLLYLFLLHLVGTPFIYSFMS